MSRNSDLENSHGPSSCRPTEPPLASYSEIENWEIVVEGRFFGLSAGDWTVLIAGFALSALSVFLL
jgi:hypothetical protein